MGFYLLGFPSVVRELSVFYVVVYQDSPVWSGFDFFLESFVRFVVSFMNGLIGDSCGGHCPPSPDGWLARGWLIVELAIGFVINILGFSLGSALCYDCADARRIILLKVGYLAWEVYDGLLYSFYWYYPSY